MLAIPIKVAKSVDLTQPILNYITARFFFCFFKRLSQVLQDNYSLKESQDAESCAQHVYGDFWFLEDDLFFRSVKTFDSE